jgi:alkanesulfonate monooxygenase SsuD/methylene tetrahydromethanopterin reductase-like flavin-dependent oxidoreductase (luciferase family)
MFAPARALARDMFALYIGGMGARGRNFYNTVFARQGYPDEAVLVQDLYLEGRKEEAAAALPDDFIDRATLIGPPGYVRERIAALRAAGITHLHVNPVGSDVPGLLARVKEWIV